MHKELKANAGEVLDLYLDEPAESDVRIPLPSEMHEQDILDGWA